MYKFYHRLKIVMGRHQSRLSESAFGAAHRSSRWFTQSKQEENRAEVRSFAIVSRRPAVGRLEHRRRDGPSRGARRHQPADARRTAGLGAESNAAGAAGGAAHADQEVARSRHRPYPE